MIRSLLRRMLPAPPSPPPAPPPTAPVAAAPAVPVAGEPPVKGVELHACTLFFSLMRLSGVASVDAGRFRAEDTAGSLFNARILVDGAAPSQKMKVERVLEGGSVAFTVEALVERARGLEGAVLELSYEGAATLWPVAMLAHEAAGRDSRSILPDFQAEVAARVAALAPAGQRPTMLDIGGRARSRVQRSEMFPACDVTVLDIVADPGVDVVGDAHELSRHFPADSFDFAMSVSVFEHLLMPWRAVVELNRVLRPGGVALVHTHQTLGMHDMPWDFWRFSDNAWAGLFNRYTGFEVVKTDLSRFLHIIPGVVAEPIIPFENAGGFECSTVLVRKTGPAQVDWPVPLSEVVNTSYPQGPDAGPG